MSQNNQPTDNFEEREKELQKKIDNLGATIKEIEGNSDFQEKLEKINKSLTELKEKKEEEKRGQRSGQNNQNNNNEEKVENKLEDVEKKIQMLEREINKCCVASFNSVEGKIVFKDNEGNEKKKEEAINSPIRNAKQAMEQMKSGLFRDQVAIIGFDDGSDGNYHEVANLVKSVGNSKSLSEFINQYASFNERLDKIYGCHDAEGLQAKLKDKIADKQSNIKDNVTKMYIQSLREMAKKYNKADDKIFDYIKAIMRLSPELSNEEVIKRLDNRSVEEQFNIVNNLKTRYPNLFASKREEIGQMIYSYNEGIRDCSNIFSEKLNFTKDIQKVSSNLGVTIEQYEERRKQVNKEFEKKHGIRHFFRNLIGLESPEGEECIKKINEMRKKQDAAYDRQMEATNDILKSKEGGTSVIDLKDKLLSNKLQQIRERSEIPIRHDVASLSDKKEITGIYYSNMQDMGNEGKYSSGVSSGWKGHFVGRY